MTCLVKLASSEGISTRCGERPQEFCVARASISGPQMLLTVDHRLASMQGLKGGAEGFVYWLVEVTDYGRLDKPFCLNRLASNANATM